MPYLTSGDVNLYFDVVGVGQPIIALHGLAENGLYWSLPGLSDKISELGFQFILMDMRGHGRSRALVGAEFGLDCVVEDVLLVANHLGIGQFHLLTHATGGMVGYRLALENHQRVLSLIATNTGSVAEVHLSFPEVRTLANAFRGRSWLEILSHARTNAAKDIFLCGIPLAPNPDQAFSWYEKCVRLGDPDQIARFAEAFYLTPSTHESLLSDIHCPCLIITGDLDHMFLDASRHAHKSIISSRLVVLPGRGHMSAFEVPDLLFGHIRDFLKSLS